MNETYNILTIKSDKKELYKVEKFLLNIFRIKNLPEKCFNKVYLCISEAVINSIEHGNKFDTTKNVKIQINCDIENVLIEITDEGKGFNFEIIESPINQENIRKETGRGIFIMKALSNFVEFNEYGNSVKIKIGLK